MSNYKQLFDYLDSYDVNMNVANPLIYKLIYDSPKINKLNEWLYEIFYDEIDYAGAKKYLENKYHQMGACSSFVKDGFYCRNYDWYYDDSVSLIIHTSAKNGRHASIGIASSVPDITNTIIGDKEYNEMFDYAACMVLDGINDAGVYCNINVTPHDGQKTTGTDVSKPALCATMAPRIILDKAESAADAIDILSSYNIYCPHGNIISEELHFMIADKNNVYCVEFIDNKMKVVDFSVTSLKPIMTNFYLYNFDGNTSTAFYHSDTYDKDNTTLTPHAIGLERYDTLKLEFEKENYTIDDAINAMLNIKYTNAYDDTKEIPWYSELCAKYRDRDLTIDSPAADFTYILEKMKKMFAARDRKVKNTWQTVHSAIYDTNENKLVVTVQEETDKQYYFDLPVSI